MKYLTPFYLSLMHAFKSHADSRIDYHIKNYPGAYTNIDLMREYGTLRLDGGRQSGKTEALSSFASDWLEDGGSVVVLADKISYAKETVARIKAHNNRSHNINRFDDYHLNGNIIGMSIRTFLSDSNHLRGRSLGRILFIIDEPMHLPDITKFYEMYYKTAFYCTVHQTDKLPLFFVIGMQ